MTTLMSALASLTSWITPVLTDMAFKGFVILLCAAMLSLCLRQASASIRHWIWGLSLIAVGVLPLFSLGLPDLDLPILPRQAAIEQIEPAVDSHEPVVSASLPMIDSLESSQQVTESTPLLPVSNVSDTHPVMTWREWMVAAWITGVILCVLPVVIGLCLLMRLQIRCHPLDDPVVLEAASQISDQLKLRTPIRLIQRPDTSLKSVPIVWGLLRPTLIWPSLYATWNQAQIQSVLLHEFAHIKRRDWLWHMIASLVCSLHWFNPLVWLAVVRLRIESEKACDDLVLNAGVKNTDYAQHLLDIARELTLKKPFTPAALAMARSSQVEYRLIDILNPKKNRQHLTAKLCTLGLIITLLVTLPLAALRATAKTSNDPNQTQTALTISGQVVFDSNDQPGANVPLKLTVFYNLDREKGACDETEPSILSCNEAGQFEFPMSSSLLPCSIQVESLKPGYRIGQVGSHIKHFIVVDEVLQENHGKLKEAIRLIPADYMKGQVVDEEGNGLEGVTIDYNIGDDSATYGVENTITDVNGHFEFFSGPADQRQYNRSTLMFKRDNHVTLYMKDVFKLPTEQKQHLKVVLSKGHSVSGTLINAQGNPASNSLVEVIPEWIALPDGSRTKHGYNRRANRTDSLGHFLISNIKPEDYHIQVIDTDSKQKLVTEPFSIQNDMSNLEFQLIPMKWPKETQPINVLGMTVININDNINSLFEIDGHGYGALVLDPGQNSSRFGLGDLKAGDYFTYVNFIRCHSVADFIDKLLENAKVAQDNLPTQTPIEIYVSYQYRRVQASNVKTKYMKLNDADIQSLKTLYAELSQTPQPDFYPRFHDERNFNGVMLMSVKAARWSYMRAHNKQCPQTLEDLKPYLLEEQALWQNTDDERIRNDYKGVDFYDWIKANTTVVLPTSVNCDGSLIGYSQTMLDHCGKTCAIYHTRSLDYEIVTQAELESQLITQWPTDQQTTKPQSTPALAN